MLGIQSVHPVRAVLSSLSSTQAIFRVENHNYFFKLLFRKTD